MVVADLVKRYLSHKGFQVRHVMNITDLDDRTIRGAERSGVDLRAFTDEHLAAFYRDLDELGVRRADAYPRASEHVEAMLRMTERLEEKGYAYEQHGSVYFDISKFPRYGQLSRVDLGKIRVGSTVDLDDYQKDNPRDFTLLKRSTLAELKRGLFWQSKWGNVRPGWHVECAAISSQYLGDTVDIHTSDTPLVFPHHENEIAICEAASGKPFVRHWLHSEPVLMDGKKMSRELGNYVTMGDLQAKGFTGREIRFFLLGTHYRKPLHFSYSALHASRRVLDRLDRVVFRLRCAQGAGGVDVGEWVAEAKATLERALDEDLNVSGALAAVFGLLKQINPLLDAGGLAPPQAEAVAGFLAAFNDVFGILELGEAAALDPRAAQLICRRDEARRRKDWGEADRLRGELAALGVEVADTPAGTRWQVNRKGAGPPHAREG
jgi:cysteinyl-tRNA synthetase